MKSDEFTDHPAFPVAGDRYQKPNTGMSMFDFFAAHALCGFTAQIDPDEMNPRLAEDVADAAILVASKMMKLREQ